MVKIGLIPNLTRTVQHLSCLVLLGTTLWGCSQSQGTSSAGNSASELPIGVALALTGNASLYGQESLNGIKVAETRFNAQKLTTPPIRMVIQDTGSDEAGAVNAFQTLINQANVLGIIGPTLSQQAFSADPIAERAGVPVVAPSNTAVGIPEIGLFISRVSAPVSVVAPAAIKAALKLNPQLKRVAVFYAQDDAFSRSETEIFQKTLKAQGLEIVTVQKGQTTDTDFQSQVSNALRLNPDLVVISGLAADGGNLIRQLRELNYKGLIIGGNGVNTVNLFPVCRAACDGVLVAQAYSPENPSPTNQTFRQAFEAQLQQVPSQFSAQAYTAAQVLVESLNALGKTNDLATMPRGELRQKLNQQLLQGTYDTPLGEIKFTPNGDVIQRQFYVGQIQMNPDGNSGKFALLQVTETEPSHSVNP
ncbi:ABC transporter substrate-binding protein [Thermosynechococcaceae cyanobacterium BACA0444]|uniref:ABC transporter substrate-binding protein n=1 Tax=Pseudocalidococcus azoricus BACA0444 TaxID=2918990 RepID=A0AAE4FS23_9CYAN|nr:ABC transporter substrate-binding protein [Pseudocalidococcus azoricus]MDS3861229.1 ABC transporter substrate-binding protein [Pseudocalidococcus azoricus BACA0444]